MCAYIALVTYEPDFAGMRIEALVWSTCLEEVDAQYQLLQRCYEQEDAAGNPYSAVHLITGKSWEIAKKALALMLRRRPLWPA